MDAGFAQVPGAVTDERGVLHFGQPFAEQRALATGSSLAPLGDRRVLAVAGEDRLSWLDSLTSQALTTLAPGESTELLVLDPNGRVEHAASVLDDGETTWLIVDADDAEPLLAWLMKMRFRLRVAPRDASDEYAVARRSRRGHRRRVGGSAVGSRLSCGTIPGRRSAPAVTPTPSPSRILAQSGTGPRRS